MSVLASYSYEIAKGQCSVCGLRGGRHATELDCFDALLLIVKAHRGRIWAGNIAAAVSGLRECIAALEDQSLNRARKGRRT